MEDGQIEAQDGSAAESFHDLESSNECSDEEADHHAKEECDEQPGV